MKAIEFSLFALLKEPGSEIQVLLQLCHQFAV
jgi:hypothetical protein